MRLQIHDETLRDGLQSPSVRDPSIAEKIEILHLISAVGADSINIGLPAAGPRVLRDVVALAHELAAQKLPIRAGCAGRTVTADLAPIAEVSQRAGIPIEALAFVGSSPIRRFVEGWTVELVRERAVRAIEFARKEGLAVTFVTEDTTRTPPEVLRDLFAAAIDAGASRLCLCDTVGHATPDGARSLVRFTRSVIDALGADIGIDWHGHDDRGLSVANALAAAEAGASRIHGCVLGIGERTGNPPLELLLLNLERDGRLDGRDLGRLPALCGSVGRATGIRPRVPLAQAE